MSAAIVRRTVLVVCAAGIAGMIAMSIADSTPGAMTFGLVTAVAVLCSIVATAVSRPVDDGQQADAIGARVEERVSVLVAAGADEGALRALVADAVRLGRATR